MLIFVENRRKSFFTMIQKAQYQEPQSEIILLSAPAILTSSPDSEGVQEEPKPGEWAEAPYNI